MPLNNSEMIFYNATNDYHNCDKEDANIKAPLNAKLDGSLASYCER